MTIDLNELESRVLVGDISAGEMAALIEVVRAAFVYTTTAPFPAYIDHQSEQAGRRLEEALATFGGTP